MSKIRESIDSKKGAILLTLGAIASIGIGFVIYKKKDSIKNYITSSLKKEQEEIVNDVDHIMNKESETLDENNTGETESKPIPLKKGASILDELVQENEKSRVEKSDNNDD